MNCTRCDLVMYVIKSRTAAMTNVRDCMYAFLIFPAVSAETSVSLSLPAS